MHITNVSPVESDYVPVRQTLTFAPGQTSVTFPVMAREDQIDESREQFSLELANPTNGATVGSDDSATVFIDDTNSQFIILS